MNHNETRLALGYKASTSIFFGVVMTGVASIAALGFASGYWGRHCGSGHLKLSSIRDGLLSPVRSDDCHLRHSLPSRTAQASRVRNRPLSSTSKQKGSIWQGILEIRSKTRLEVLLVCRWLHLAGRVYVLQQIEPYSWYKLQIRRV